MLLISEGKKMYCFTGCSHHGILNMVESAQQLTGTKKMSVIGGFHMYNPLTKGLSEKKEDVIKTAEWLNTNPQIDSISTGHCTGAGAFTLLENVLGKKLLKLNTGSRIEI
jgi:7,8-dihydropterin-6-yl-methyl-4-(beta-D-ribofuranosyl)aminobenzene 5'-phosphate synthase